MTGPSPRPRVVVVTGCGSGVGLATAQALGRNGDIVVATVRDPSRADALRDALAPFGERAEVARLDVTSDTDADAVVADVVERHGRIDVLVNNAGRSVEGTLEDLPLEAFRSSLEVNFIGALRVTRSVLAPMRASGGGRIITVSSISGIIGTPFGDAYTAAKHALEGAFECLAPVSRIHGTLCTLVEPGPISGEFVTKESAQLFGPSEPYREAYQAFETIRADAFDGCPTPADVAAVIVDVSLMDDPPLRVQDSEGSARLIGAKLKDVDGRRVMRMAQYLPAPSTGAPGGTGAGSSS